MNPAPDRDGRLDDIILAYLDAESAGRRPARADVLAAHPAFRAELEEFFAAHDAVERVAAPLRSATAAGAPAPPAGPLGQLGEYRLIREVGRGGMGVVYEAEQVSLRRRVALKVLPFAAAVDPRRLQRFKNEALAAASLRHEHIVAVHGVGCDLGVHYYAMQFVEGRSLAEVIAEFRKPGRPAGPAADTRPVAAGDTRPTGDPGPASGPLAAGARGYCRWAAGLGRQAALALDYAHQFGVVHRDVKPANLLLDVRGHLWVTDFGMAQVAGDPGVTATGEFVGTLRYASPEQARVRTGVADHRADVYSLGATLYELLTLRPVFDGHDRLALLRRVADDDPAAPRAVRPDVPVDLETVVLKALSKDPADRYQTAEALADDLGRYLDGRPVLARRPSRAEQVRKWGMRHPAVVAVAAGALCLVTAGSVATAGLVRGEQRKAEDAYRRELQRADEAEAEFRLARRSVDELFRVSEDELAHNHGAQPLRRRLLGSVLAYYQEFIDRRRNDPGARDGLVEASRKVERILADLAVLKTAGQVRLLKQSAVWDDLRLDGPQRAKIADLSARVERQERESFRDIGLVSAAERERRSLEQARADEADVRSILSPEQFMRFHQVWLQADVVEAFREPEVADALKLSDDQRDRVRTIEEERMQDFLRLHHPKLFPPGDGTGPRRAPTSARLLNVLTADQTRRWRELTGAPIDGRIRPQSPFEPDGP